MLGQEIRVTDNLVKSYIESGQSYASEEFSSFYYFAILVFFSFLPNLFYFMDASGVWTILTALCKHESMRTAF